MKILYYNWIQFDKKNNSGGGVNVYQKNVIEYLINNTEHEVYFLSSGIYYDLISKRIRIVESTNEFGKRCHTFKLINSTCMAPVKAIYEDIDTYLSDMKVYQVFASFVKKHGFDVIHFNNIEGLPLNCLKIKRDFPDIKVLYSQHNYYMFCPQVNLFYNNSHTCEGCKNGINCRECLAGSVSKSQFKNYYKLDTFLERVHLETVSQKAKLFFKHLYLKKRGSSVQEVASESKASASIASAEDFKRYLKHNVGVLNKYVDSVLAVSDRAREIALKNGVDKDKVHTVYVGTKVAEQAVKKYHGRTNDDYIVLGFMGYFEILKGLEFLLNALERLPEELQNKVAFKCYAGRKTKEDDLLISRIKKLDESLVFSEYHDGYNHSELPDIMKQIDLGVIPVLWEDNLPQVAIEFTAYGVPVLSSDLGGARELSKCDGFVFEAGNEEDFIDKLKNIVTHSEMADEYFEGLMKPVTVEEHINNMFKYYV